MSTTPKWLQVKETTRSRSKKQESKIAKDLKGRPTLNSGACFGENDVLTDYAEIEAKTTKKESFVLKVSDIEKMNKKCALGKLPIFVIDYETSGHSMAVIQYDDLKYLIRKANE